MKKYLLGLFAILLAIGFSSFKAAPKKTNQTVYFWYDANTFDPVSVGQTAEPDLDDCLIEHLGDVCAIGFLSAPSDPATDPYDETAKIPE